MNTLPEIQNQEVAGWPAYHGLVHLTHALDNLFESPFQGLEEVSRLLGAWSPAVDISEDKDSLHVTAELPGLNASEIEVSIEDGTLSISGERKVSETHLSAKAHRTERFSGKFRRQIALPSQVDAAKVSAQYKEGVLSVLLPKAEEARRKQIEVKVS